MAAPDGGSAFPFSFHREWKDARKGYTEEESSSGMSLRDYFAAKAMAAFLVSPLTCDVTGHNPDKCSEWAYQQADAMLKARDE